MKFGGLEHFRPTTVPVAGGITEVPGQRASTPSSMVSGVSRQVAFPGAVVSGNLLVVAGAVLNFIGTPTVTDTLGTVYTVVPGSVPPGGAPAEQPFIAYGLAAGSGANTVTVTTGGSDDLQHFAIDEFQGVNATPLDVNGGSTTGTTSGAPATAADSITTVATGALIVGVVATDGGITTPGASYVEFGSRDPEYSAVFRVVTTPGAYVVDWSLSFSGTNWSAQTISFKP